MVNDPVLTCAACGHVGELPEEPDWSAMNAATIRPASRHPIIVHHDDDTHDFMWDADRDA